jgi:DNA polymerase-3 subunit epsilon
MRHIILDTETTGFDPNLGHRIVEVGCLELINHIPSGKVFHHYVNPERDIPQEAQKVHGISTAFVKDKPLFAEIAGDFLEFIAEDPLVIHNASFDMSFLNAELSRLGFNKMPAARAIDTLAIARKKFPGAKASLDALCVRFNINTVARSYHGALLDAQLLADVYLELIGGRQPDLSMGFSDTRKTSTLSAQRQRREPRPHTPSIEEEAAHAEAAQKIKGTLWG